MAATISKTCEFQMSMECMFSMFFSTFLIWIVFDVFDAFFFLCPSI